MRIDYLQETLPFSLLRFKQQVSVLSIACLVGCKHTFTQLEIEAPPTTIWEILSVTESYSDWNPYHKSVTGQLAVGQKLEVMIHKPNGNQLTIHPHVIKLEPNRELVWGGGIEGIFKGEHSFRIETLTDEKSLLIQEEWFHGIAVPFAELDTIEEGYHAVNLAIKRRAESQNRAMQVEP